MISNKSYFLRKLRRDCGDFFLGIFWGAICFIYFCLWILVAIMIEEGRYPMALIIGGALAALTWRVVKKR